MSSTVRFSFPAKKKRVLLTHAHCPKVVYLEVCRYAYAIYFKRYSRGPIISCAFIRREFVDVLSSRHQGNPVFPMAVFGGLLNLPMEGY